MKGKNILVTGGAGFIGNHLAEHLLQMEGVEKVRILDNFSTGSYANIERLQNIPAFECFEGDIRNINTCIKASKGIDLICHQAALGSVPRSIEDPVSTHEVNVSGTFNIFYSAKYCGIKRVVYASSSAIYGDHPTLPKKENITGNPLSPYALSKWINEKYAGIYAKVYGLSIVGLRYFNIFGPRQDPNGPYAAVIPIFMKAAITGQSPVIHGDGSFSRDFTYIDNAVDANIKALFSENITPDVHKVYNVACGTQTRLDEIWDAIQSIAKTNLKAHVGPPRKGDIPHSLADISLAKAELGYIPNISVYEGLEKTYHFIKAHI
ncbi:MAG TPA: NAD-dependent epimerase/dehydratase family protein [Saprospiraceae bacterium]|nr:NAD-dependent epimerase/dehydratase family protein [Saprospiraceae bacterium]